MEFKYRVGVENEREHIDFWDYEQNELDLAKARFDEIKIVNLCIDDGFNDLICVRGIN